MTDSTVYLRRAEAEQLRVRIVPIGYSMNGCLYSEYYSDDDTFEEYLALGGRITTSQPTPAAFLSVFREELAGNEVLCITLFKVERIYNSGGTGWGAAATARVLDSRPYRRADSGAPGEELLTRA